MRMKGLTDSYWQATIVIISTILILVPVFAFGEEADEESTDAVGEQPVVEVESVSDYVGTMSCLMCHEDYKIDFLMTRHALSLGDEYAKPSEQGCEQCHGAGSLHMESIGNESGDRGINLFADDKAEEQYLATCLECHDAKIDTNNWMEGYHKEADLWCASCHDVHSRENSFQLKYEKSEELCYSCHTSIKSQFVAGRSHHPLRDDKGCVICHNPHGEPDDLLATEMLEDVCGKCHSDTVGPFIYQHLTGTSDMGEGCFNCHMPHSSGNLNLLKANGRALCLSCHTELGEHKGAATCWTSGCHSQVHGSNDNILFIR